MSTVLGPPLSGADPIVGIVFMILVVVAILFAFFLAPISKLVYGIKDRLKKPKSRTRSHRTSKQ